MLDSADIIQAVIMLQLTGILQCSKVLDCADIIQAVTVLYVDRNSTVKCWTADIIQAVIMLKLTGILQ